MANDECPAPSDHPSVGRDLERASNRTRALVADGDARIYRVARRHRDDRRIVDATVGAWHRLAPIRADNLCWPTTRRN